MTQRKATDSFNSTLLYLANVVEQRLSGELIVTGQHVDSGASIELHVFLQEGRLAFATASGDVNETKPFTDHLIQSGVDADVLADALVECRQSGLRVIDTLIEWRIASPAKVREALLVQLQTTLGTLTEARSLRPLFLARALRYDPDRTFSLTEVVETGNPKHQQLRVLLDGLVIPSIEGQVSGVVSSVPPSITSAFEPAVIPQATTKGANSTMSTPKEVLPRLLEIDGSLGACIVDSDSGMMLAAAGGGDIFDLEIASAGNTEVVRAKRKTMSALQLDDEIEDILITLGRQYHVIRPLRSNGSLFIYLVLDRTRSNLAMARHQLRAVESDLSI